MEMCAHTNDMAIDPLTLRLANRKTLDNFKEWISEDDNYWLEQRPKLEAELYRIKEKQGLTLNETKTKKHKSPHSIKTSQNLPSDIEDAIMYWGNHELDYVRDRNIVETHLSSQSTNINLSRVPRSIFKYIDDPVYSRCLHL